MRLRMSAYTSDPNLLAEFQRNLPGLEKFLRSNGAQVTLRIDSIEEDGHAIIVDSGRGPPPQLSPQLVKEMKRRYDRR